MLEEWDLVIDRYGCGGEVCVGYQEDVGYGGEEAHVGAARGARRVQLHAYSRRCVIRGMHNKQDVITWRMQAGHAGVLVGGAGAVVSVWPH